MITRIMDISKRFGLLIAEHTGKLGTQRSTSKFALNLLLYTSLLVLLRGQAATANALFNPDEAEFLALGKQASSSLGIYGQYSTSTLGPVLPELLGFFGTLGLSLNLQFAHVLTLLLSIGVVSIAISVANNRSDGFKAIFLLLPVMLLFSSGDVGSFGWDLLSLSPALVAVFFLGASIYLIMHAKRNIVSVFGAGIFCGFSIFSKYQVIPMVLILPILISLLPRAFPEYYSMSMISLIGSFL